MPDSETVDDQKRAPSPRVKAWTVGLLCVSAVASGVIVAGLIHTPEPELTTAVPTSRPTTTSPETTHIYRTPDVSYPVQIPGCATVEPPGEGRYGMVGGLPGYDNPAYPWFSEHKAVAMSNALRSALPDGVVLDWASINHSLVFQPILGDGEDEFGGFTHAEAGLRRGFWSGSLWVSVRQSREPVPPCVAGSLDERRILTDGTTVDLRDTWSEIDGVRTEERTATAYRPDGSVVSVRATDANEYDGKPSGTVPFSRDELATLATLDDVRVTAPIPPGTSTSTGACSVAFFDDSDPIPESTARRLDAVLAGIRLDGYITDRPLTGLRPGEYDGGGLCLSIQLTAGDRTSRLELSIRTGIPLPTTPPRAHGETTRTLPDGAVVATRESEYATAASITVSRTVSVTHRSGTRVELESSAAAPAEPLTIAELESIALTPGLDVNP
ncbi:hypothetical protein [Nocardia sp. NPDC127526]|uniref:hypothetical protein n=1 Tax=Nocardia sp. NPDC127526 TaxID=3345393 RepID=UPI003624C694